MKGIAYAMRLATRQGEPAELAPETKAIWDALWFRFMLVTANGVAMLGMDHFGLIPLLVALALVDTLSYPVVSQIVLRLAGMADRFPVFLLSMSWIGNLRVMLMMTVLLVFGGGEGMGGNAVLAMVAVWMIWAAWSVASRSLGGKGLAGAGMLVLLMVVEVVNASIVVNVIRPLVPEAGQ